MNNKRKRSHTGANRRKNGGSNCPGAQRFFCHHGIKPTARAERNGEEKPEMLIDKEKQSIGNASRGKALWEAIKKKNGVGPYLRIK